MYDEYLLPKKKEKQSKIIDRQPEAASHITLLKSAFCYIMTNRKVSSRKIFRNFKIIFCVLAPVPVPAHCKHSAARAFWYRALPDSTGHYCATPFAVTFRRFIQRKNMFILFRMRASRAECEALVGPGDRK